MGPPATRSRKRNRSILSSCDTEDRKPPKRPHSSATERMPTHQQILSSSDTEDRNSPERSHRPTYQQSLVPLSDLVRYQELWFSDGSIILAAGNKCFKVHRSQLSRFCTVFEDMFVLPSGGADEEMMEGVVVVRMHDDVTDLANFLSTLYGCWSFNFDTAHGVTILGLMRLAAKYDCSVLQTRILEKLRERYHGPCCLGTIDKKSGARTSLSHAAAIQLAREFDIPEILPSCFYELAFCPTSQRRIDTLSPTDQSRLEDGRSAVLKRISRLLSNGPPDIECPLAPQSHTKTTIVTTECTISMDLYWKTFMTRKTLSRKVEEDPLRELSRRSDPLSDNMPFIVEGHQPICLSCRKNFIRHMDEIVFDIRYNFSTDFKL